MKELMNKVDAMVNVRVPSRPSYFQLQYFLIDKEPTHQAKLRRIIEELRSRKRDVDAASNEIAECLDRRRLMELGYCKDLPEGTSTEVKEIRARMILRRVEAIDRQVFDLRQVVANKVEEMQLLCDMYERLIAREPHKDWDSPEVQLEYWETKLRNEISLRIKMKAPIDVETVKTALALPKSSLLKQELLGAMAATPLPEKLDANK